MLLVHSVVFWVDGVFTTRYPTPGISKRGGVISLTDSAFSVTLPAAVRLRLRAKRRHMEHLNLVNSFLYCS